VKIVVVQGSILEADVQAIVNAANSSGYMGGVWLGRSSGQLG
jgi:O-acetyl-ADP-ribose deacetylase (regulator of RNase III)